MALRMPCPMKRKGSSFIQFRQRVPADLIGRAKGVTLVIPVGDTTITKRLAATTQEVSFSLRTRDPAEAKRRQATATAYVEGVWGALRSGARKLSHKQIVALAGEVYRDLVGGLEDNPGSVKRWQDAVYADVKAQAGVIDPSPRQWPLQIPVKDRRKAMERAMLAICPYGLQRGRRTNAAESRVPGLGFVGGPTLLQRGRRTNAAERIDQT